MKTTTTLMEIVTSELINAGFNEFSFTTQDAKGRPIQQLFRTDDRFTFIRKLARYDDDIDKAVDKAFFFNQKLNNIEADKYFKHMFITKFMDRQIGPQTVETFGSHLTSLMLQYEPYITELFTNVNNYYHDEKFSISDNTTKNNGTSKSDTTSTIDDHSGTNSVNRDLPQDNATLDLTSDEVTFANTNDVSRSFNKNTANNSQAGETTNAATSNTTGNTYGYNVDTLQKLRDAWSELLDKFDAQLFIQTW